MACRKPIHLDLKNALGGYLLLVLESLEEETLLEGCFSFLLGPRILSVLLDFILMSSLPATCLLDLWALMALFVSWASFPSSQTTSWFMYQGNSFPLWDVAGSGLVSNECSAVKYSGFLCGPYRVVHFQGHPPKGALEFEVGTQMPQRWNCRALS